MLPGALWLGGYLAASVVLAVLAYAFWRHRRVSGVGYLFAASLLGSVGALCYALALVAPALGVKVVLWQVVAATTAGLVACWYLFVVTWTGRERLASSLGASLALAPLAGAVALIATNTSPVVDGFHSLVWTSVAVADPGAFVSPLSFVGGPAALALEGAAGLLIAVSGGLLAVYARRDDQRLYRWRNALVGLGLATAFAFAVGLGELVAGYRPDPFAAAVGLGLVAVGLLRFGLSELVSLPENSLIEAIEGGVLVYDTGGRVVDCNSVAGRVLALDDDAVGRDVVSVVEVAEGLPGVRADGAGPASDVGSTPNGGADGSATDPAAVAERLDGHEFTTTLDGASRTFLVRASTLDDDGVHLGWTVLLYDVTELRQQQDELDLLKGVLSRVLRHNVRNDLSVVKTNAEALAADASGLEAQRLETILEKSEDLLDASEKARIVERVLDGDRDRGTVDLVSVATDAVEQVEPAFPDVEFRRSVPDRCDVRAHWALATAVENLVENGAVHNEGDTRTVGVAVDCDGDTATLTVADDGPGIPRSELDVLDRREETQLEHGSSIGLWLVDWIADLSGADVEFENTDRGCTVVLTFDRASDEQAGGIAAELGVETVE